jgi:hypothetical protein
MAKLVEWKSSSEADSLRRYHALAMGLAAEQDSLEAGVRECSTGAARA